MENPGVSAALVRGKASFLFHDDETRARTRIEKRVRGRKPEDPTSDDCDVEVIHERDSSAAMCT